VRLHGAVPTVEADHRTLERHCGASFEHIRDAQPVVSHARDLAANVELVVHASVLPSRLVEAAGAVLDAVGETTPFVIDTYRGTIRLGLDAARAPEAAALRPRIEALGGALSAYAASSAVDVAAIESRPSPAVAELTARLERVFDPRGVFWPCRP
jgi:hypothetical protein